MSLRKTACFACASAKRRCDMKRPSCSRCCKLSLNCEYPYQSTFERPQQPDNRDCLTVMQSDLMLPQAPETDFAFDISTFLSDDMINMDRDMRVSGTTLETPLSDDTNTNIYSVDPVEALGTTFSLDSGFLWDENSTLNNPVVAQNPQPATLKDSSALELEPEKSTARKRATSQGSLPVSKIGRPVSAKIWPRGWDKKSWSFCADILLSYVGIFSRTAFTEFILPPECTSCSSELRLYLWKALAVCAAHETLSQNNTSVFEQILAAEVSQLIEESKSEAAQPMPIISSQTQGGFKDAILKFHKDLARLQAMVLYQIICLFGASRRQRHAAEGLEPLFASWTRELLLQTRMLDLQLQTPEASSATPPGTQTYPEPSEVEEPSLSRGVTHPEQLIDKSITDKEIESSYRTILISYMIRGVYAASEYQSCHLVTEMGTLPACISGHSACSDVPMCVGRRLPVADRNLTYARFAETWNSQDTQTQEEYDKFSVLLLVACKGLEVLPSLRSERSEVP